VYQALYSPMMIALVCARIISQMIQPNNIKPSSLCVGVVNTSRGAAAKRSIDADAACMQSSAGATDYSAKVLLSRRSKRGDAASARKTPIACQAIPELNAGVALRLLISMNQNKRSFARRATASKRKSSHHNARSRKHIWFHMVWSRLEQCDQIFCSLYCGICVGCVHRQVQHQISRSNSSKGD